MKFWKSQNNSDSRSEGMEEGDLEKGMGVILEVMEMLPIMILLSYIFGPVRLMELCTIKDEFLQHVNYLNKPDFKN